MKNLLLIVTAVITITKLNADVDLLLKTKWSQTYPYNYYCPIFDSSKIEQIWGDYRGRSPVGCIATAIAQIINYNYYTKNSIASIKGVGNYSYTPPFGNGRFGEQTAVFDTTWYRFYKMKSIYSTLDNSGYNLPIDEKHDVAILMYHCGIAVNMRYGIDGSIGENHRYSGTFAIMPWCKYFGFDTTAKYIKKENYNYIEWKNILKSELDSRNPIYYGGAIDELGIYGHAWIIDGYEERNNDTYFYVNFGYGGDFDDYDRLDSMHSNYNNYQIAIIGLTY